MFMIILLVVVDLVIVILIMVIILVNVLGHFGHVVRMSVSGHRCRRF